MNIKELFDQAEGGTLTYEQFEAAAKTGGAKFADLSEGKYVSTSKYNADLKAKDTEIEGLNTQITDLSGTIATRDTDLVELQKKVEAAGEDATKIADLNSQITDLQSKYDRDVQDYQSKMAQQSYEFAVREFANTLDFTSQAAKRDFTQAMIARQLQMEGNKLLGREDFVEAYSAENADAFKVAEPDPVPTPEPEPIPEPTTPTPVPTFVAPTPGPTPGTGNETGFNFNFTGVRAH